MKWIVERLCDLTVDVAIAADEKQILRFGEKVREDARIQGKFIDGFDGELRTGGVVARRGDIQRGDDNGIHLSEEQPMLVVLLVESNVMDACAVGHEMRGLLFGVGEQWSGFTAGQRDGDE